MTDSTAHQRFLDLLDEHKKIVHKVARSYTRTDADRQDLEQEILVQLWRAFARYDERYRYSTWMCRIALNTAISWYRSESRRQRTQIPADVFLLQVPTGSPIEPDERLEKLEVFIDRLGELDRALILLYLDGAGHETISEILGISKTNVGTRIGRIKQRLRQDFTNAT